MKPVNFGGHSAYQDHVLTYLRKYYPDPDLIPEPTWVILDHFWQLDLSNVDTIMQDRYSIFGPAPRLPSCMLRSMLLMIEFKVTSFTEWASQLRINPLYAIASGFIPGDTPGIGTFYDFNKRLWLSESKDLTPHERVPKEKVKRPRRQGEKADPIEKTTVEDLIRQFRVRPPLDDPPFARLFDIFHEEFLNRSADKGLIDMEHLALAGDGSPVQTSARERSRNIPDQKCGSDDASASGVAKKRYYSQPDCDIGWDSSRGLYYSGYDMYLLTASDSESDLPVFPYLSPASRHDSQGFLYCWFLMKDQLPEVSVSKVLLDSAHDASALYEYFRKESIVPFIDLNQKRGRARKYKDDFTIGEDGVPICRLGRKMNHDGSEPKKHRLKFRCPLASRVHGCSCPDPCSDSKYGRTVHLQMKDDPRMFNIPPRDSDEWKQEYNARTSAERCNKRIKVDLKLEDGRHRSSREWYCRLYCIMMCQHLNAWDLPYESELRKSLKTAA